MKARAFVVLLSLTLLVGVCAVAFWALSERAGPAQATNPPSMDAMSIDMNPLGNTASGLPVGHTEVLGTVETCARINENDSLDADEDAVDTLQIDVTAVNIPASNPMIAFAYMFNFPTGSVRVAAEDQNFLLRALADSSLFTGLSDALPDSVSPWNATAADGGSIPGSSESGSGVLDRLEIQTFPGSVSGVFPLTLSSAGHLDTDNMGWAPDLLGGAQVAVNGPCPIPTDLKVTATTISPLTTISVNTAFDVTVDATVHNNGPAGPATVDIAESLNLPADCTTPTNPIFIQNISPAISSAMSLPTRTFPVTCTSPSFHNITATATLTIVGTGFADSNDANDSMSASTAIAVTAEADFEMTATTATAPASTTQEAPFNVSVGGTIQNNGPNPGPVVPVITLTAPPDCTITGSPRAASPVTISASMSAPLPAEVFSVSCIDAALDTISATVDLTAPLHVTDAVPGNNSALGQTTVQVLPDDDRDRVQNSNDQCPATAPGATVDSNGCAQVQVDADLDGVCDPTTTSSLCAGSDQCPATAAGATIDSNGCSQLQVDADLDGVCDPGRTSTLCAGSDNCPSTSNSDQSDVDGDTLGNVCDPDADGDTLLNGIDNCWLTVNPVQQDFNADGNGDHCSDWDGDGLLDIVDLCKLVADPDQGDADGDGMANPCDSDDDNDTVVDWIDNCQYVANPSQADMNANGQGDACEDQDGDGVVDGNDNCVLVANPGQENNDGDALGDACDSDDDNDGVPDITDNCYLPNPGQEDVNTNGIGDACEDNDADGVENGIDNCPADFNPDQQDVDGDGLGDICDPSNTGQTDVSDPGTGAISVASAASDIVFTGTTAVPGSTVTIVPDTEGAGTITTDASGTGLVAQRYDLLSPSSLTGTITQIVDFPMPGITAGQLASLTVTKEQAGGPLTLTHNVISTVPPSGEPITQATIEYFLPNDAAMVVKVPADSDLDGVVDQYDLNGDGDFLDAMEQDNCLTVTNGNQRNTDAAVAPPGDALGDACDSDDDDDGYFDSVESHVGTDGLLPCGGGSTWPADFAGGGIPDSTNRLTILDVTSFLAPVRYFGTDVGALPGNVRWDIVPGKGLFVTDINIADLTSLLTVRPPMLGGVRAFNGPVCPFAQ